MRSPPAEDDAADGINEEQFARVLLQSARELATGPKAADDVAIMAEIVDLFDMIDADGSGNVTWDEFSMACLEMASMAQQAESGGASALKHTWTETEMPMAMTQQRICGTITACKFVPDLQQIFVCDNAGSVVRVLTPQGRLLANLHAHVPERLKPDERRPGGAHGPSASAALSLENKGVFTKWQRWKMQKERVREMNTAWARGQLRRPLPGRPGRATIQERTRAAHIMGNEYSRRNTETAETVAPRRIAEQAIAFARAAERAAAVRKSAVTMGSGFVPEAAGLRPGAAATESGLDDMAELDDPEHAIEVTAAGSVPGDRHAMPVVPGLAGAADDARQSVRTGMIGILPQTAKRGGPPAGQRLKASEALIRRVTALPETKAAQEHARQRSLRIKELQKVYADQADSEGALHQVAAARRDLVSKRVVTSKTHPDPLYLENPKAGQPAARLPLALREALQRQKQRERASARPPQGPGSGPGAACSDALSASAAICEAELGADGGAETSRFVSFADDEELPAPRIEHVDSAGTSVSKAWDERRAPRPAPFHFVGSESGRVADVGEVSEDKPDPFVLKSKGLGAPSGAVVHCLGVEFCRPRPRSENPLVWRRMTDLDAAHLIVVTSSEGAILAFRTRSFSFFGSIVTLEQHFLPTWAEGANALFTAEVFTSNIFAWDLLSGTKLAGFRDAHSEPITAVVCDDRNAMVVTAGGEGTLRLWDGGDRVPMRIRDGGELGEHPLGVKFMAAVPHGPGHVVTAGFKPTENYLWNVTTRSRLCKITGHAHPTIGLAVCHDLAAACITADELGTFRVWALSDASAGAAHQIATFKADAPEYTLEGFTTAQPSGEVVAWSSRVHRMVREKINKLPPIPSTVVYSESLALIVVAVERSVRVYSADDGSLQREMPGLMEDTIVSLALDGRERKLIVGDADGRISQFALASGFRLKDADEGHGDDVTNIEVVPEDGLYVTASWDRSVAVFSDRSGGGMSRIRTMLDAHSADISAVSVNRSINLVATGAIDGTLRLWALDTLMPQLELDPHGGPVSDLEFASPDKDAPLLISSDKVGRIKVFCVPPGRLPGVLLFEVESVGVRGATMAPHMIPGQPAPPFSVPGGLELTAVPLTALEIFVGIPAEGQASVVWVFTGDGKGSIQWWDFTDLVGAFQLGRARPGTRDCDRRNWDPEQVKRMCMASSGPRAFDPSKAGAAAADVSRRRRLAQQAKEAEAQAMLDASEAAEAERKAKLASRVANHIENIRTGGVGGVALRARPKSAVGPRRREARAGDHRPEFKTHFATASSARGPDNPPLPITSSASRTPGRRPRPASALAGNTSATPKDPPARTQPASPKLPRIPHQMLLSRHPGTESWLGHPPSGSADAGWIRAMAPGTASADEVEPPEGADLSPVRARFLSSRFLRGFRARTHFTGHTNYITALRFVEDPRSVVSSSQDGSVRLWRVDGTPIGVVMCAPPARIVVHKPGLAGPRAEAEAKQAQREVNLDKAECPWSFEVNHTGRLAPIRRRALRLLSTLEPKSNEPRSPFAKRMWRMLGAAADITQFESTTDRQLIQEADLVRKEGRMQRTMSLLGSGSPAPTSRHPTADANVQAPGMSDRSVQAIKEVALETEAAIHGGGMLLASPRVVRAARRAQRAEAAAGRVMEEQRRSSERRREASAASCEAEIAELAANAKDEDIIRTFDKLMLEERQLAEEASSSRRKRSSRLSSAAREMRDPITATEARLQGISVDTADMAAADETLLRAALPVRMIPVYKNFTREARAIVAAGPGARDAPGADESSTSTTSAAVSAAASGATSSRSGSNGSRRLRAATSAGSSSAGGSKQASSGDLSRPGSAAEQRLTAATLAQAPSARLSKGARRPVSAHPVRRSGGLVSRQATRDTPLGLPPARRTPRAERPQSALPRMSPSRARYPSVASRAARSASGESASARLAGIASVLAEGERRIAISQSMVRRLPRSRPASARHFASAALGRSHRSADEPGVGARRVSRRPASASSPSSRLTRKLAPGPPPRAPSPPPSPTAADVAAAVPRSSPSAGARPPRAAAFPPPSRGGIRRPASAFPSTAKSAPAGPGRRTDRPASAVSRTRRTGGSNPALEKRRALWSTYGRANAIASDGLPVTFGPVSREQVRDVVRLFLSIDADASGEVSVEEFLNDSFVEASELTQFTRSLFRSLDTDSSGSITLEELLRAAFLTPTPEQFRGLTAYGRRFHEEQGIAARRLQLAVTRERSALRSTN